MARKPVHLELAGGKSQRQRIWEAIRAANKPFTQPDVSFGGMEISTVREYLTGLVNAGYLELTRQGSAPCIPNTYRLVRDAGAEAPRVRKNGEEVTQGHGNEAIWGAMQALGTFTGRVLASMSGASEQTVRTYCLFLERAGYLTVERQGKGKGRGGIPTQYRLLVSRVRGPRPPMITKLKAVYDPNIHAIVWQQDASDALEAAEAV